MSNFFPPSNYPSFFSTCHWIDAWQEAWADQDEISVLNGSVDAKYCRRNFYQYRQRKFLGKSFITSFPAGISTTVSSSLRSEYFQLGNLLPDDFFDSIGNSNWDQLFIPDILLDSCEYSNICAAARVRNLTVLHRENSIAYAVNLRELNFTSYLNSLSGSTRLKLFNKRKKLYEAGSVRVQNLWPNLDEFISIINQFHCARWGVPCYKGRNLKQIVRFLQKISGDGGEPDLSVVYCNNKAVSAVLDLSYRKRIYNIQSGYIEDFQKGTSLGTLHFGLQLEKAFNSDAEYYDFMAGNGKNSNYKKSLATHSAELVSLMIVQSPILKALYFAKNKMDSIL
ncbi:MAG: GNAT family N-acetyltransferase [Cellvibrio sp.]|uniref:GNAT family N-acetyltransferase n=1 Tax=Cellvibrio sp. TaxID=1965322 RepID=UPI0031A91A04